MASNYPGSLDSFDTIASDKKTSDSVGGRTHRQMHNDLGDAIESVQTELGTNPSGSDATVAARLSAIEAGTNLATGAVTSAKIADGTIVNDDINASAAIDRSKISGLPTSSTDNTVPRFNGTAGALQTSLVSVDDDGGLAVTAATDTTGYIHLSGNTGGTAGAGSWISLRDNNVPRWWIGRAGGSQTFTIRRADSNGDVVDDPITIDPSTGRVTVGVAGVTAGVELGGSGPTITTGTGAPSHSAPNGSVYHRQDGTASTTLYVRAAGAWSALS